MIWKATVYGRDGYLLEKRMYDRFVFDTVLGGLVDKDGDNR